MRKIIFVCLGNICRSPMAELVCKDMLDKRGLGDEFEISSAGTSDEEEGNPVYPPVARLLTGKGIDCTRKRARQLTAADGDNCDLLVCMDDGNLRAAKRIVGERNAHKCVKLMSYTGADSSVADPWYTRDFQTCYDDVSRGLAAMLDTLLSES